MSNVVPIKSCAVAPIALRNIADGMESGEINATEVTIIVGTDVYHCGGISDERAAESAIFNMTLGIHKMMRRIFED